MANKPDKFEIKFWMLVDNDTKYLSNAFPYLGKDELRSANESLTESVVMRLMSPYLNKGRNVTTDSFFTSASLAWTLKAKDTSIVGIISRTQREIPAVLAIERVPLHETTLLRNGESATLTVYQEKVNKNVLLLSTCIVQLTLEQITKSSQRLCSSTKQSVESIFLTK
jgi:phage gp46-like protein